MNCQRCATAEATCHLTERSPSGSYVDAHYCETCCQAIVPGWSPQPCPPHTSETLAQVIFEALALSRSPVSEDEARRVAEDVAGAMGKRRFHYPYPS